MPPVTLEQLASAGDLASLRRAGAAHAAVIRSFAAGLSSEKRAIVEGRVATVLGILLGTADPATAAAAVKELEQARSEIDVILARGKSSGMSGAPEGADLEAIRSANRASLGLGAPDWSGLTTNLFNATVRGVTLKSSVTPDMRYAPGAPGQPSQVTNASGGPGEFILKFVKPEMDIETPTGTVTVAPYGQPTNNYFWPFVAVVVVGFATVGYFAAEGLKTKLSRRKR